MATEQRAHSSASNVSDVGTRMSEQQLRDLRQIFDWIDVSGDNSIAAPELLVALKAASSDRATIEEAENLIRTHAGANRSTLGWFEFLNIFETSLAHSETHSLLQRCMSFSKSAAQGAGPGRTAGRTRGPRLRRLRPSNR